MLVEGQLTEDCRFGRLLLCLCTWETPPPPFVVDSFSPSETQPFSRWCGGGKSVFLFPLLFSLTAFGCIVFASTSSWRFVLCCFPPGRCASLPAVISNLECAVRVNPNLCWVQGIDIASLRNNAIEKLSLREKSLVAVCCALEALRLNQSVQVVSLRSV